MAEITEQERLEIEYIPYELIEKNPNQVRKTSDAEHINSLRIDMLEHGIREPLKVKFIDGGKYQLIDGEHRYDACRDDTNRVFDNFKEIPCIVLSEEDAEDWGLVANILRKDLTPCELSNALTSYKEKTGLDNAGMAEHFGKTEAWVYDYLLLQKLPPKIMEKELESGKDSLNFTDIRKFSTKKYRSNPQRAYELYESKKKYVTREREKYKDLENRKKEETTKAVIPDKQEVKRGDREIQSFRSVIKAINSVSDKYKNSPSGILPSMSDGNTFMELSQELRDSVNNLQEFLNILLDEISYREKYYQNINSRSEK